MKNTLTLIVLIAGLLWGCKKIDDSKTGFSHLEFFNSAIVNPGDSSLKNSSIDLYSPLNDSIWYDAYRTMHGKSLGLYVTAGERVGNDYWLLAPLENKILILNSYDLSIRSEITGIESPQCIEVGPSLVYIGSRDKPAIYKINIDSHDVKEIPVRFANITDIEYYTYNSVSKILIACHVAQNNMIYTTEPDSNSIIDSILLNSKAPLQIAKNDWGSVDFLCGSDDFQLPWYINENLMIPGVSTRSYALPSDYNYSKMTSSISFNPNILVSQLLILGHGFNGASDGVLKFKISNSIQYLDKFTPTNLNSNYKLTNFFIAPNLNVYMTGYTAPNNHIAFRNYDFVYHFLLAEIPTRDSLAFILFRPEKG